VRSILYFNGGGHAGREDDARRYFIYMNTDRDALGETHPHCRAAVTPFTRPSNAIKSAT
jgi:hypothetical protein